MALPALLLSQNTALPPKDTSGMWLQWVPVAYMDPPLGQGPTLPEVV